MTELQRAAAHINSSETGAIACVMADRVEVQVPAVLSLPGGRKASSWSNETVTSLPAAIRLVNALQ